MVSKGILLTICVVYLATLVVGNGDLTIGTTAFAQNIYHKIHSKPALPIIRRSEEIKVRAPNNGLIKGVVIKDLKGNGESHIRSGGLNKNSVTIKLESKGGHGYEFSVDVYA
ncbi:PREDICTED: uncharacterized protein LOC106110475 [Papilio polytes]|uniref:uncharacterized protein LOC106110475 n=1 Tax=Papilio polytes TaxID=76194 RepID=UPI000676361B|nr:PREDICTED: uncharacterized protein LOC106110475 [Papilio polytes]